MKCKRCGAKGCPLCGRPHDTFGWDKQRCLTRFDVVETERSVGSVAEPERTYIDRLELHVEEREDGAWDASIYRPEYDHYNWLELGLTRFHGIAPNRERAERLAREALANIR